MAARSDPQVDDGAAAHGNAAMAPTTNCTLVVPRNPLSARGLASPYRLRGTGGQQCHEADLTQSAFVEAAMVNPRTGALRVYRPLVIDAGTRPAVRPVMPRIPAGSVVGVWFGFNGDTLSLQSRGGSLAQGNCVNGLGASQFGQFAYCNAPAFFNAAHAAIRAGKLAVPALGTGADGQTCMTVRDFGMVDQDQSDNVTTSYLAGPDGQTAQNTGAAAAQLAGGAKLSNGSDNGLLDAFIDPALNCTPFTAPDLTDHGKPATSLALNELQAAARQAPPAALVPLNDPMTLVDGQQSVVKTNLYRAGVDQPAVNATTDTPQSYCTNINQIGFRRLNTDHDLFAGAASPDPAMNLFEFLSDRLNGSLQMLGCPGQ
jgi:hypothetical protein